VEIVLGHEGGYVWDPDDPGGETNLGISKRQYPEVDIKYLSPKHAKFLYKRDYWNAAKIDALPCRLRLVVFDCSVNQGVRTAIKLIQKAARVTADGSIGPISLEAIHAIHPTTLKRDFLTLRVMRYTKTRGFDKFGKGWIKRVFDVARY